MASLFCVLYVRRVSFPQFHLAATRRRYCRRFFSGNTRLGEPSQGGEMLHLFEGDLRKKAVLGKILEGDFEIHAGNYEHALREYQLDMSVTQLRNVLGSLIAKEYVRRYRCEPSVLKAKCAGSTAGERGVALTVHKPRKLISRDVPYDPYENREVWLYEPSVELRRLLGMPNDGYRGTFVA